jgi:DNA-binding XRE family transcriptional regulator
MKFTASRLSDGNIVSPDQISIDEYHICRCFSFSTFSYLHIDMQKVSVCTDIEQYVIDKVKEIRTSKKISQAKLAHLLDLLVEFIGNVENPSNIAKYNLNQLNRISKELLVPFKNFFPEYSL